MKPHILVTGAAGYLDSVLCECWGEVPGRTCDP